MSNIKRVETSARIKLSETSQEMIFQLDNVQPKDTNAICDNLRSWNFTGRLSLRLFSVRLRSIKYISFKSEVLRCFSYKIILFTNLSSS